MENLQKATHQGVLRIGGFNIRCAVLDDGTRILVERSVAKALGVKGAGAYWEKKKKGDPSAILPEYISAKYLQPFVSDELREKLAEPIEYINKQNKRLKGLEATVLPDVCDVWIKAKEASALDESKKKIAQKAYILMKGFANIGIIALIDEATGYQEIRDKRALREILDRFLLKEQARWAKRFPDEFYEQMFRLKNWQWKGMKVNRPSVVGKYTNDLVYERLAPDMLRELKRLNPPDDKGRRKSKHQQWLTEDIGHPALQRHLHMLIGFERASANWEMFYRMVQRALPKLNEQIPLALEEGEK